MGIGATSTFEFEHTFELTEQQYVNIASIWSRRSRPWRRLGCSLVAAACVLSSYTLLLGATIILCVVLAAIAPRRIAGTAASKFHRFNRHLQQAVTYGVSDEGMWARAETFRGTCSWTDLAVWRERDDWLRLSPHCMTEVFFRISDLKAAGIYPHVMEKARAHGRQYNAPKRSPARQGTDVGRS